MAALAVALGTSLAACEDKSGAVPVFGGGFFAAVTADEPLAALAGRDILSAGGNAIDAAVAAYFVMSATLPSAASLGAGGVCLVNQHKTRKVEAITFASPAAPGSPPGAATFAIPTVVRGLTLMHARYGQLRWEQLLSAGERWARPPGAPVSRALARDLRPGAALIGYDPEARRTFDKGGGVAYTEGDVFPQPDLAGILGGLRLRGGQDFFAGSIARQVSEGWRSAGGNMPPEAMRAAVPASGPPLSTRWGSHTVFFAPSPYAGSVAQAAWAAGARSPAPPGGAFDGGTAGFAAVDNEGNGVACTVGMGQLFGARRIAPATGIMIGAATGRDQQSLSPMLIANTNTGDVLMVGTASGSAVAAAALGAAAAQVMQGGQTVASVLPASPAVLGMIACPVGLRQNRAACQTATDSKGHGLAIIAGRPLRNY
jgi:gamma-glutamyltranspeptidase/glutathione hydrolase